MTATYTPPSVPERLNAMMEHSTVNASSPRAAVEYPWDAIARETAARERAANEPA